LFEEYKYKYYATLIQTVELLACEADEAPEYNRGTCASLMTLLTDTTSNSNTLPARGGSQTTSV
jgi:hypothetical protein